MSIEFFEPELAEHQWINSLQQGDKVLVTFPATVRRFEEVSVATINWTTKDRVCISLGGKFPSLITIWKSKKPGYYKIAPLTGEYHGCRVAGKAERSV